MTIVNHTTTIAAAYLSRNQVSTADIPLLLGSIYAVLAGIENPGLAAGPVPQPAVAPKHSIKPDHLICLCCGSKNQMIKRHLRTSHGLTPDAYRAMWNLPPDYPMVAPDYAAKRSDLAKQFGLGRTRREAA